MRILKNHGVFLIVFSFTVIAAGSLSFIGRAASAMSSELVPEEIAVSGDYYAIFVENDLAYTVTQGYFQVLDVADVSDPKVLGYYILPNVFEDFWVEDLVVRDGYAYIAMGVKGLRGFYVGDPASIVQVWEYGPADGFVGNAIQLDVSDDWLYAAAGDLYIFDLGNPAEPQEVIRWNDGIGITDVLADGDTLYLGCWDYSSQANHRDILVLDVADPSQPVIIGETDFGFNPSYGEGVYALALVDHWLYAGHGPEPSHWGPEAYLWIIDVADPSQPVVHGSEYLGGSFGDDYEIVVDPPRMYFSNTSWDYAKPFYHTDFDILNISDPDDPVSLEHFYFSYAIFDMIATDEALFAAGRNLWTGSFPILSSSKIKELGLPAIQDMVFEEAHHTTYIAGYGGLTAIPGELPGELPEDPQYFIYVPPALELFDQTLIEYIWYEGFWSNLFGGVTLYDISDPTAIEPLAYECSYPDCEAEFTDSVAIGGDLLYFRTPETLLVFDYSNPALAKHLVTHPFGQGSRKMAAVGDLLITGYNAGFVILDFSDPFNPVTLATETSLGTINDLVLAGDLLYLASSFIGLAVFDLSDPTQPAQLGALPTLGTAREIVIEYPVALVADGPAGLRIIDIADPENLFEIAYYDHVLDATQVAVDRDEIWLVDPDGMTFVFKYGHSIQGSVIDQHGNPIGGVFISSDQAGSQTTTSTGGYSFNFLFPGKYTLNPEFGDHHFVPAARTVSVPFDAFPQTFVMLGAPASVPVSPGFQSTLVYTDTQGLPTTVSFPPGSVAIDATAYVTPTLAVPFPGQAFAYHGFDLDFPAVDGCPSPVVLAIVYSELDQAVISDPASIALWKLEAGGWLSLGGAISSIGEDYLLEIELCQPGRYSLFGPSTILYFPFVNR